MVNEREAGIHPEQVVSQIVTGPFQLSSLKDRTRLVAQILLSDAQRVYNKKEAMMMPKEILKSAV